MSEKAESTFDTIAFHTPVSSKHVLEYCLISIYEMVTYGILDILSTVHSSISYAPFAEIHIPDASFSSHIPVGVLPHLDEHFP